MRRLKIFGLMLALVLAAGLWAGPALAGGVKWLDYPAAVAAQQKQAKPMLVYFHLPYCYRCKDMKRKTYSQPEVISRLNTDFLAAKVDLEQESAVGEKFQAEYTPSYVFLDAGGKEVFRTKGVFGPQRFLKLLSYVSSKAYQGKTWDQYQQGD
ncbi:MAG: thioredoxin family protein [Desulfarculaceae bacterium]|nr:thioredoxin family protein [Desulfarculaceae bacterium]MCF8072477.1 thioredoxin family protein [Desulfarculaceae bacterium]MCF8102938.1 thioredoxin family protein [Desulfarculaceae bacterium]MCF8117459.1 thioredoxin family protein [Desulfarculaceae bacterium]